MLSTPKSDSPICNSYTSWSDYEKFWLWIFVKGPFALGDDDTLFSIFFVMKSEKKKWVAWLPMIPFVLNLYLT